MISFDDFAKLELKVGTILEAEEVEGSEKLIKLKVDLGYLNVIPAKAGIQKAEESNGSPIRSGMTMEKRDIRQILAGIKQWYAPQDLVGRQVVVVANLAPRMMMGLESQGMMLMAGEEPVLLIPQKEVPPGTKIR